MLPNYDDLGSNDAAYQMYHLLPLGIKPGRLFDCQFYHADAWICMSQDASKRKYDWIEYEDGRILGKKDQCESK